MQGSEASEWAAGVGNWVAKCQWESQLLDTSSTRPMASAKGTMKAGEKLTQRSEQRTEGAHGSMSLTCHPLPHRLQTAREGGRTIE